MAVEYYRSKFTGEEVEAYLESIQDKQDKIEDLRDIRTGAQKGATALQSTDVARVAMSGSYNDLKDKPDVSQLVTKEELKDIVVGDDGNDHYYIDGYGEADKKYTLLLEGVTEVPSYQIIAETDIAYTGTSSSSFIALNYNDANGKYQPIASINGYVGQIIPKGTIILEGNAVALPLLTDVSVGNRYAGTLKVALAVREESKGVEPRIADLEKNSATKEGLASLGQDLIAVDESIRAMVDSEIKGVEDEINEIREIIEGEDTSEIHYAEGAGTASKSFTKILSNVTSLGRVQIIAETDITYTGSSNGSTFVTLAFNTAGNTNTGVISNLATPINGTLGQVISKDTIIIDYAGGAFAEPYDIYVGSRYSGKLKVVLVGEKLTGLKDDVEKNTTDIQNNSNRISTLENSIDPSIKPTVDRLNEDVEGIKNVLNDSVEDEVYYVTGEGSTDKTWEKILTNVTSVGAVKIIAETDIAYTGTSASTFVSYAFLATGASGTPQPIIESERGVGLVFPKGTIIINHAGTTLPYPSDIYIGARYSGTLKIVYEGEKTLGLESQVEQNTTDIARNADRISALEGGSSNNDILALYHQQIQRARQVGYASSHSSAKPPIQLLAFMHISDTHSVRPNKRAIEILNYLGANGRVKFLMHTGDILRDPSANDPTTWASIVANAHYPVLVTAGNHDVGNWKTAPAQYRTDEQFYNMFVAPQIGSWGLKTDGGGTPHINGKNYYFTDFTEEKIRFVVTYEYEIPSVSSQQDAGRGARWISQEQIDWLINTLLTTPQGYGVILAHHAPEGLIGNDENPFNSKYRNNDNTQQTFQYRDGATYTALFADIVQAFIDRQSINFVVAQSAASYQGTLSVVADFSNVAASTEFICHVSGHVHADNITHLATHPQQLELNINCDNTIIDNQRSEVLLIEGTSFEDAINVYGIDRNLGEIYVLRIGADYSGVGERKDMMTISYRYRNEETSQIDEQVENNTLRIAQLEDDLTIVKNNTSTRFTQMESSIQSKVDKVEGKGLSTNDYTSTEKTKLSQLSNYNDTEIRTLLSNKVDKISGKGLSTNDYTNADKAALAELVAIQEEASKQVFHVTGQGSTSKTFEKIMSNVDVLPPVKIIAETDIAYTGTSSSTFISIAFTATGATTTPQPIVESDKGVVGQIVSKGTTIIDYAGTTLPSASDIYVGARYSGTLKIVIG